MKRVFFRTGTVLLAIAGIIFFTACTKDEPTPKPTPEGEGGGGTTPGGG